MKRGIRFALGFVLLLVFGVRIAQVFSNMDAQTGFYLQFRSWLTYPIVVLLLIGFVVSHRAYRRMRCADSDTVSFGAAAFILTSSTGLGVVYACVRSLFSLLRVHPIEQFFMSAQQLRILGISSGVFKAEAVVALLGLASAVWFIRFALPRLQSPSGLFRSVWFSLLPPAWYLLRAAVAFISQPVNSHDTVELAAIAAPLCLAHLWFSIVQQISFPATEASTRRMSASAFATAACCCCLALPDLILSFRIGDYTSAVVRVCDALSAFTACYYANRLLKTAKEVPADVQS